MRSISKLVLPMVVLNMGGEMMNIFQQRLRAQNIEEEKATAVLQDLIRTMYAPKVRTNASKARIVQILLRHHNNYFPLEENLKVASSHSPAPLPPP